MKKRTFLSLLLFVCTLMLSACNSSFTKSVTFSVDNGDKVKITVDAKAGYGVTMEVPLAVTKGDETILNASFAYADYYDSYYQAATGDPAAALLDEGTKDGNDYFYYTVDGQSGTEHNYVVKVKDSQTLVVIGSLAGEAEAQAAFEAMTISLAE